MRTSAGLFTLLNEFVVLLLGALLVLIGASRYMALPSRPVVLFILGGVFILWGARAWQRPAPNTSNVEAGIRAGSLVIVGILLVAIPLLTLGHASLLLAVAGGVLVIRGILVAVLSMRAH
ncbi:MAG TPA: hypothetical protein VMH00_08680 [Candidatus Limnocylindrales bacterium]|nr:hypothetical protein [Candidatus Limnocylindrales bacterium]